MADWKFCCETRESIPLPPEYTFPQAFNYLNPECNSFYILTAPNGDYLQCGGSKERCTVERRIHREGGYDHEVLGKKDGSEAMTHVDMTAGGVDVQEREVFRLGKRSICSRSSLPAMISLMRLCFGKYTCRTKRSEQGVDPNA